MIAMATMTNEENIIKKTFAGVTDFKAVKDSSRSEGPRLGVFDPSFYFMIAGAAFATTLTLAAICVVLTFRRKVEADIKFSNG